MSNTNIFYPPVPDQIGAQYNWVNLNGASVGLAVANAILHTKRPLLIIAEDNLSASHLWDELHFFNQNHISHLFPDWETLPYDHFSPHQDIISDRLITLFRLPGMTEGAVITTINTLSHRLPPRGYLDAYHFMLKVGDRLNLDILKTKLTKAGYHSVSQVKEHGEFAVRGSILDLFPMGSQQPFRIDLFGDEVDSIRIFSTETQRTLEKINEIRLLPAKEFPFTEESIEKFRQNWRSAFTGNPLKCPTYQDVTDGIASPGIEYYFPFFFNETATLFDYLPNNTLLLFLGEVKEKSQEFWHEINQRYEQGRFDISRPLLSPEKLFLKFETIQELCSHYARININNNAHTNYRYEFDTKAAPIFQIHHQAAEPLSSLKTFIADYPGRVLFCAETTGRREVILQLFRTISLSPKYFETWTDFINSNTQHGVVVAPLEDGFCLEAPHFCLITESQLYGKRIMQRRLRKKTTQDPDAIIRDLTELQIGDPVVHIDHGVGRYHGLQTLTVGEQLNEFLSLEYQGGDKLYVPVSSLHLISRYTGTDPEQAPINKLGGDQWSRAKRKAAEKVRDVAAELLDLYAKRASRPGENYQIPEEQYSSFAAAFPFEETPDQLHAIEQVFTDLTSSKPMDRVICGDVGFGKTEVAMRAAFLAVQNNKQVAVLVPTTLLAQQHFQNFQDRFADWPIQVEMLSRFRTAKEQKNVLEKLKDGKVDIVIGTHKLIQNDIQFKSLGLVIIDEEHRFGVKQKEKLKALRSMVDILTLTATPIPRTLNMALSGIRDLSLIATPPARRLSVKTFVHEYHDQIIQEAIQREILRGGQVYFLHNEVSSINKKAEDLAQLVKEARITVAHGQMHERDLERVMSEFYHRHFNVLVCSTIIESGIDIPTANTIIINRADKFGVAQLHQLRGRVGRSHHQAYAYLLTPPPNYMTSDAKKRLEAIASLGELGVGFTLATHDLEIRGAGELLGEEQSGEMQEIGFTLYMDLLSRAVDALKHGEEVDLSISAQSVTEIDLHLSALIPESYLRDVQLRLQFYKRIASAKDIESLDEIQVEMIDRFGLLPQTLKNLFAISELKLQAAALGILKIDANEKGGKIEFNEKPNVKPETIIKLIQLKSRTFKLDGPTRIRFSLTEHVPAERIILVKDIVQQLKD